MIELHDVRVRYPGAASDALNIPSLAVAPGEFLAVMGANGSGKSTFARCLNGLIRPSSGEVTVDGLRSSNDESRGEIRRRVGLVFQNPHLQITSLTVEREIAFGLQNLGMEESSLRDRVEEYLETSALSPFRRRSPGSLSGGEQQRLAVAAVLAMHPAYLILDEATSLLSPSSRAHVLEDVSRERAMRRMSVVLITQFAAEAVRASRLIMLREGQVAMDGTPSEVFERCALSGAPGIQMPRRTFRASS
ncbi:MAG TPA: ATP-binding cassette domain-containing protein [Bacteroidota bacterium]|nr:ATP-binding cassette domain-containing protein [Bacteroidota bacterium]